MKTIKGTCNSAVVFTDDIEAKAEEQLIELLSQEMVSESKIRIMPDCHAGTGCVIGTTMTITDKICPNLVGVDIGCGMLTARIPASGMDFKKLDDVIHQTIPSGFCIRSCPIEDPTFHQKAADVLYPCCGLTEEEKRKGFKSVGTLGGGNHFIEIDKDEDGRYYIVIHSGSRSQGAQCARHYQDLAAKIHPELPKDLAYLEGGLVTAYIRDMHRMQQFASLNREVMLSTILNGMDWVAMETFETVHNYISGEEMILRKGAVSAKEGETLLIPLNMRDGSLICRGKGNADWNYSAPHGAGRALSRGEAKKSCNVQEFKKQMNGIFSTCISEATLDESPMAYKSAESIIHNIGDTVEIVKRIRPVYNFKAK